MKVVSLETYRRRREIEILEKRVGDLALRSGTTAREIKTAFKEWLVRTGTL